MGKLDIPSVAHRGTMFKQKMNYTLNTGPTKIKNLNQINIYDKHRKQKH